MSRFTPLHKALICIFCIYWFIFFPIIWFVAQPEPFSKGIGWAILFAAILFVCYCIIHVVVICIFEICDRRRRRKAEASTNGNNATQFLEHDTVIFEKQHGLTPATETAAAAATDAARIGHNGGPDSLPKDDPEVRFVSSCKLFYDGRKFRDNDTVSKY